MNDLLAFAIDAHGGMARWNSFTRLTAGITVGGAIWEVKQQPGLLTDKVFEIETRRQHLTVTPFGGAETRLDFLPDRLTIETMAGETVETRRDPAAAFAGQLRETPWDKLHVAYFVGEALWTYLTSPFLYTWPGFETEEIEPWRENDEAWRRLKVSFPDYIASHTRTQITHFGPDGLMRRHDYTVDILGGATGANYPSGYKQFQGLMMPTRRRIYAYDADNHRVPEPLLVSLDFGAITFS